MRTLVVIFAFAAIACEPQPAPNGLPSETCEVALRLPSGDARAMFLGPDGKATQADAKCDRLGCLRTKPNAVAIVQPDGTTIAAWPGRALAPLPAEPTPTSSITFEEVWARDQAHLISSAHDKNKRMPRDIGDELGPPALPPTERTCGIVTAGDGLGYHIIRNRGDVWQRVHWVRKPSASALLALPNDAYPIVDGHGALCAYGTQQAERVWRVHLVKQQRVVDARPDFEHVPARCLPDGAVEVRTPSGLLIVHADGTEALRDDVLPAIAPPQKNPALLHVDQSAMITRPASPAFVKRRDGTTLTIAFDDTKDLAGRPFASAMRADRERFTSIGDDEGRVLVVERVLMSNCATRELLHVIDARTGKVTPISEGDVIFGKLGFALGTFWWVESQPQVDPGT